MKTYVIGFNRPEAQKLFDAGFGYESKSAAQKAIKESGADPYYRNQMKIYEFAEKPQKEEQ